MSHVPGYIARDASGGNAQTSSANFTFDGTTLAASAMRSTSYFDVAEIAAPATPDSGFGRLYAKTDGNLYFKNDAGTEFSVNAGGGGIGGTVVGGTAGSVLFVGAGGVLAQDNANLFWDDGNNRLGLGTASPSTTLHVVGGLTQSGGIVNLTPNTASTLQPTQATSTSGFGLTVGSGAAPTTATASFQTGGTLTLSSGAGANGVPATFAAGDGGAINIVSGAGGAGIPTGGGGTSGAITLQTPNASAAGGGSAAAASVGLIRLLGGTGGAASTGTGTGTQGGSIQITAGTGGAGSATANSGVGGAITITTGTGGVVANSSGGSTGGTLTLATGNGGNAGANGGNNHGGALAITLGFGSAAGTTSGNGGTGGTATITAGVGGNASTGTGNAGAGGAVNIASGAGGVASATGSANNGGAISLTTGAGGAGNTTRAGQSGGALTLTLGVGGAGGTTGAGGNAGSWTVTGATGGTAGTVSGNGGIGSSFALTAGSGGVASVGTGSAGAGGSVSLTSGSGGFATSTGAAGNGGAFTIAVGIGRAGVTTTAGSAGGQLNINMGVGGDGGTTGASGAAGSLVFTGAKGGRAGSTSGAGSQGSGVTWNLGAGGDAYLGSGAAGTGGSWTTTAGTGGMATPTGTAGIGGAITITAGAGGTSAATVNAAGVGGSVTIQGGAGGTNAGAGGADGGSVVIRGGLGTGGSLPGTVSIGVSSTSTISIGASVATLSIASPTTFTDTVTMSTMTSGSLLFAGTSGLVSQDNANLFWDDGNNRLGVGTATPASALDVSNLAASTPIFIARDNTVAVFTVVDGGATTVQTAADTTIAFRVINAAGTLAALGVDTANGRVGIRTGAPTSILQVEGETGRLVALFNNNQADSDLRIAGTTQPNLFYVDAGANRVGIGTSVPLAQLDVPLGQLVVPTGSVTSPSIAIRTDLNTGFYSPAADRLNTATGGVERVSISTTEVVFNDPGNNVDFRVEGSATRPDLFLVDAGTARVGINRAAGTHGATLDVDNLAVAESVFIARDNGTPVFTVADGGNVLITSILDRHTAGALNFGDGATTNANAMTFAPVARAGGVAQPTFRFTEAAHTNQAASSEVVSFQLEYDAEIEHATGALATQRAVVISAPSYSFVGASTITTAASFAIAGPPVASTNATITNNYALWVQSGTTALNSNTSDAILALQDSGTTRVLVTSVGTTLIQPGGTTGHALTLSSASGTTGRLLEMDADNTSGTVMRQYLGATGSPTKGFQIDWSSNYLTTNPSDFSMLELRYPSVAKTANASPSTYTLFHIDNTGNTLTHSTTNTLTWYGGKIEMPTVTKAAAGGTLNAYGLEIGVGGFGSNYGTAIGLRVTAVGTGTATNAGLAAIEIANTTTGTTSEAVGMQIGTGWNLGVLSYSPVVIAGDQSYSGVTLLGLSPFPRTAQPASTELSDVVLSGSSIQFNTGAITNQRSVRFNNQTYSFVAASTITNAATVYIEAAPIAGTNATITNNYALWVDDGDSRFDGAVIAPSDIKYQAKFIDDMLRGTALAIDAKEEWDATSTGTAASGQGSSPISFNGNDFGVQSMTTGTATDSGINYMAGVNTAIAPGFGKLVAQARVRFPALSTVTEEFVFRFGFSDSGNQVVTGDSAVFEYDRATAGSDIWRTFTSNDATTTSSNESAITAGIWYDLRIEWSADASTVTYYIDDTLVHTATGASVPTNLDEFGIFLQIFKSAGTTARTAAIDYVYFHELFTTARG